MWKLLQWIPMMQVVKDLYRSPKLSNSWFGASTSTANILSSNKHTRKAEMRSISCTLGWPVPFYPSSRNQKISFQGWLLRRCYFAIDRGFTNAKWVLRLYQRTIEGSDRAFLVTPWKGGVGGLDMFLHPPLDHYKIMITWYKLALLTGMDRFWSSWWSHSVVRWPLLKPLRDYWLLHSPLAMK